MLGNSYGAVGTTLATVGVLIGGLGAAVLVYALAWSRGIGALYLLYLLARRNRKMSAA